MEDAEVVHVLDVAAVEVERSSVLFRCEVQSVQRFCLSLRDRWNICRARKTPVPGETSASVLDDKALRIGCCGGLMVQERDERIGFVEPAKSGSTLGLSCVTYKENGCKNSPVGSPRLGKGSNQVRPRRCQLVVHLPAAGEVALPALRCLSKSEQRNNIPDVGVEDLLLCGVCRGTDLSRVNAGCEIFDMGEHHIGWLTIMLMVLAGADWGDVGGDAGIYDDVLFAGVEMDRYTLDYLEAMAVVDLVRDLPQLSMKIRQRERLLRDVAQGLIGFWVLISAGQSSQ